MTYRVPTNTLAPPANQMSLPRPWRGSFIYPQTGAYRSASPQEIFVTAAETEGDNRVDLWNLRLFLNFTRVQLTPRELTDWLQRNSVPMCAFMPDRLSESNAHAANHRYFQSLSQMLTQNQVVAFAPFNPTRPRSPGILIFPTNSTTDALLIGAVILNSDLLSTISGSPSPPQSQSQYPQGPSASGYSGSQQMQDPNYPYQGQQQYYM